MAQLSTLALILATAFYVLGRLRLARGEQGLAFILVSPVVALIGFFGKENAVLLPLLLLVCELTVLSKTSHGSQNKLIRTVQFLYIGLPLLIGTVYLATHTSLFNHAGQPFTLEERVLTQPRVLWTYVSWIFAPNLNELGLYHDGYPVSRGLLEPPTTLVAVLGLGAVSFLAIAFRSRYPLFAFAVLFFLAAHALESSIFPLELVFEHRNYLPSFGLLMLLGSAVVMPPLGIQKVRIVHVLGALLLVAFTTATTIRVGNWSTYQRFLLTAAGNHPESPRAQFAAAKYMIAAIPHTEGDKTDVVASARAFLRQGMAADPECINCLFGELVLDLHLDQEPRAEIVDRLVEKLSFGSADASRISVGQFVYLVKWQRSGATGLSDETLERLFDAALANPAWPRIGRASLLATYREYYEDVKNDLDKARFYAEEVIRTYSRRWNAHFSLVEILEKQGRIEEAILALEKAGQVANNERQRSSTKAKLAELERQRQDAKALSG